MNSFIANYPQVMDSIILVSPYVTFMAFIGWCAME